MSRHHNLWQDGVGWFWTSTIVEWTPILRSPRAAALLLSIWDSRRERFGVRILGYVVMPEHFHILLWGLSADSVRKFLEQSLRTFSSDITAMTARAAERGNAQAAAWLGVFRSHARGKSRVRVWKERGHGLPVTTDEAFLAKLAYMHNNPMRRGLCQTPEDWLFSSASWYDCGSGPLRLDSTEELL